MIYILRSVHNNKQTEAGWTTKKTENVIKSIRSPIQTQTSLQKTHRIKQSTTTKKTRPLIKRIERESVIHKVSIIYQIFVNMRAMCYR